MNDADFKILQGPPPIGGWELTPDAKLRQRALELAIESARALPKRRILETANKYLKFLRGETE